MGRSGSGLGMTVVWSAVKDHLGYVDIESREGEGTRLTYIFRQHGMIWVKSKAGSFSRIIWEQNAYWS